MNAKTHWNTVYRNENRKSWFRPHLETSLRWITALAPSLEAAILDAGGGESTLVDDLLGRGYRRLTVLDLSEQALERARRRLGDSAGTVDWRNGDITGATLPAAHYHVWHDRAAFHFLFQPESQAAYVRQARHVLAPGGHLIMAVFGPDGPHRCSGLPVCRYHIAGLQAVLGTDFQCQSHHLETHQTPEGHSQQFLYAHFQYHPTPAG